MDADNSMGVACGSGGQAGWRETKGENWDNCNSIINNIYNSINKFLSLSIYIYHSLHIYIYVCVCIYIYICGLDKDT